MSRTYAATKLRRAVVHFLGGKVMQALARAALVLLMVRLLPPADYGAYMLVVGVAEMLLQFSSFGILSVGHRFLPEVVETASIRWTRRFVAAVAGLQLLTLTGVCSVLWLFWGDALPHLGFTADQIERSRLAMALFVLIPSFRLVADLLEALLEQGKAQAVRVLMPLGRVVGVSVLLSTGVEVTLERVLMVDGLVTLLCLALAWLLMARCLRGLEEPDQPRSLPVRAMLRHAGNMATVEAIGTTQAPGALRIVLASTLGIVESGLFAFLQSLQNLVGRNLPGTLMRGLVRPMLISRAGNRNGTRLLQHGMALLLKANLLVVAAAAIVTLIGGDQLVLAASGGRFADAGDTLLLMFLALIVTSSRQLVQMLIQILNQTQILRTTVFLAPFALAAVWLSAGAGLNAAVVVAALGVGLIDLVNLWRLRAATGRSYLVWSGVSSIVLPAVGAALFGSVAQNVVGPWLAMVLAFSLLGALLVLVKPLAPYELSMADRGIGAVAARAIQPFVSKAAL